MSYLLGIDIGTSGTKSVLFDEDGHCVASATKEYPMYQPQNGWAEQDPEDWWEAVQVTCRTILKNSGIPASEIKGIGLSGQMHGLVMLDAKGKVLRPSIIWCDQRTAKECEEITERVGAGRLLDITANPALTGFTASKILWVRNHEPELYQQCRHILLPKDYIRFRLTGTYATDVSDASGMQLLDIRHRCWSDEVLEKLEIPKDWLGDVYESPEVTGYVTKEAESLTDLAEGTPVVGGAGDNAAAAVGTGVVKDGTAFTTIGTSGVVFAHTSEMALDPKGRVHTFCCAVPGAWHVMGVTQAAGLSLKWFRDEFCIAEKEEAAHTKQDPYVIMTREAQNITIGSDKLIYLPYLMGERTPHLDPDCRGAFFGLSAIHTRAHLIRAVMEGVGYSLRDGVEILQEMGTTITDMRACGGGSRSPLWRQMLSDLYRCPVATIASEEGPALGVAILAGVGAGIYGDVVSACERLIKTSHPQTTILENAAVYDQYYALYRSLYFQLKESYQTLASFN